MNQLDKKSQAWSALFSHAVSVTNVIGDDVYTFAESVFLYIRYPAMLLSVVTLFQ